jgi:hypothetical protein
MGKIGKFLMSALSAYGYTKFMQKTGMNIAEAMLYKDVFKTCNSYYSKKTSYMLKSIFAK